MECRQVLWVSYSVVYCQSSVNLEILGLSRCLSQVIFTFFPTPAPAPTLYGDPVNGSMSVFVARSYKMCRRHNDVLRYTIHSDLRRIFFPYHYRDCVSHYLRGGLLNIPINNQYSLNLARISLEYPSCCNTDIIIYTKAHGGI
jgi:hypothetical protein